MFDGITLDSDLGTEVASLIDALEARRRLTRKIETAVAAIEGEGVYTYTLRNRDGNTVTAGVVRQAPTATIVTAGDDATSVPDDCPPGDTPKNPGPR